MRRSITIITLLLLISPVQSLFSYKIIYAEQYYRVYHHQLYMYPEDILGNIWYLKKARSSDMANPLNAMDRIDNPEQWERYRYLFYMHVNLELVRQYRLLASKYDKRVTYFYNAPWQKQNLESLDVAEAFYREALTYWEEALDWSMKAWRLRRIEVDKIQGWADDNWRIENLELDYEDIILDDLDRVARVRADFEAMDSTTY